MANHRIIALPSGVQAIDLTRAVIIEQPDDGAPRMTKRQRGTAFADVLEVLAYNHAAGDTKARGVALALARWLDSSRDEARYHLDDHGEDAMERMGLVWDEATGWAERLVGER